MADVSIEFNFSTDELTKRLMTGNVDTSTLDARIQHAGEQTLYTLQSAVRSHLYPGHGYITGTLWRSYQGEVHPEGHGCHIEFGSYGCFYAVFVEFGTRKMAPRMHFRPGVAEAEGKINGLMEEAVDGFLDELGA
jgi:hypothetical protein